MNVSRDSAEVWAQWFRCLSDPSRILILNVLATARRPMTVGQLVDRLDIGQSTVSHHLGVLADTCFVHVERQGTASYFRINERSLDCFPSAAELVMGRLPRGEVLAAKGPPWSIESPRRRSRSKRSRPARRKEPR
jgi:DNA-binding transcriptional ArsR family regulator